MTRFDVLGPADVTALETFLVARSATSMFLRANLRLAGIVDQGRPYEGTYVAARRDGEIVGVAAVAWNGKMILQAPEECAGVARAAAASAPRDVDGLIGPWDQVIVAREALGMLERKAALESRDDLFVLELADLVVPAALARGEVTFRHATDADRDRMIAWRVAYHIEILGAKPGPALEAHAAVELDEAMAARRIWVLDQGGQAVATTAFNAHLPDIVQVGGVYTPPELRSRGLARAAVAGSLLEARAAGARQAILFTGEDNQAAQRAYLALGFRRIGDYGLLLF